jgi:PAS domain S-box-containing protein
MFHNLFLICTLIGSYVIMKGPARGRQIANDLYLDTFAVPEEPFRLSKKYWIAGLIIFTFFLTVSTLYLLMRGFTPSAIGSFYAIPAILFPYFYRRKGVLVVYLLTMFFFSAVVVFRYPLTEDIFTAAVHGILLIAIALTVSYLTHYLVQEKRKYHAIFENTENGVILVSIPDNRILEMNPRFALSLGLPESETDGQILNTFLFDNGVLAHLFPAHQPQCSTQVMELDLRRVDGSLWNAVIAARKISAEHAVITFIDFTERKRVEAQLHQLHEEANLYLDILTHDINNINTASLNYGRLLGASSGNTRADLQQNLIRSLDKSDEIIRNISALRKIQEGQVQRIPLQISAIISKEINAFPGTTIEYDGTGATVMGDEMLSSVFSNLIGNAIKYGGAEPHVFIRVEDLGREVLITVGDRGKGIPDSLKPLIFDRFQRGDTTISGKGLGLYICKALIERYGGTIRVEDRVPCDVGKGAVFRFTLPKP